MMTAAPKKRSVPLFGKLAVKHNFITKEQLKRAIYIQDEEAEAGRSSSLPEILARTGMLTPDKMSELHAIVSAFNDKPKNNEILDEITEKHISIDISKDKLIAELTIPKHLRRPVTTEEIQEIIGQKKISHGMVKDYVISNHLRDSKNNGKPLVIARGTQPYYGEKASVNYLFDTHYYRNESLTIHSPDSKQSKPRPTSDDGDLLAEKTPKIPSESGIDVYGIPVEVPEAEDIILRCDTGAEIFEDQLKIFATTHGCPLISIEGKVNVFPLATISGDYGVSSGPVTQASSIHSTGTITGEYPVHGGTVQAQEIRNATIDIVGDVSVDIGITGSVIQCQGDVRAKYIHGSTIETFGSVIVEKEILDSTIISSGIIKSNTSKIIASTIAANRGVKALGIGTETSIPCSITIGDDLNVRQRVDRIDTAIEKNLSLVNTLELKTDELYNEKKEINSKIVPLMKFHKEAEKAIKTTEEKIALLKQKSTPKQLIPAEKNLKELRLKDNSAVNSIKTISNRLKEIDIEAGEIPDEVSSLKKINASLLIDKKHILSWAESNTPISMLEVEGDVAAGTILSGVKAVLELESKRTGVVVTEITTDSGGADFKVTNFKGGSRNKNNQ